MIGSDSRLLLQLLVGDGADADGDDEEAIRLKMIRNSEDRFYQLQRKTNRGNGKLLVRAISSGGMGSGNFLRPHC